MATSSPAIDYKKCTIEELQGFIRSRTGRASTSKSIPYMAGRLRTLDKSATFRFMDLPPELRLAVYAELLHHKQRYPQILATCTEVYGEAGPELNDKSNMLIRVATAGINPNIIYETTCAVGNHTFYLDPFGAHNMAVVGSAWPLFERISDMVGKARNITLEFDLIASTPTIHDSVQRYSHIVQFTFALTAALRNSDLQTFTFRLKHNGTWGKGLFNLVWPLYRIKTSATLTLENLPEDVKNRIFARRPSEDRKQDSIAWGKAGVRQVEELVALIAHLRDQSATLKIKVIHSKVKAATVWRASDNGDFRARNALKDVRQALKEPTMKALIQKASDQVAAEKAEKACKVKEEQQVDG